MAIWVFKDGVREGPYEDRDIRELIYEGTYHDADQAIRDGDSASRTLGEILGRSPGVSSPGGQATLATGSTPFVPTHPAVAAGAPSEPSPGAISPLAPPPLPALTAASSSPARVEVVDFNMPFGSMVIFMVKWALAAIPALLIIVTFVALFWAALFTFVAGILASLMHHP